MKLLKDLTNIGITDALSRSEKRNVKIVNYYVIISVTGLQVLILTRFIIKLTIKDSHINLNDNFDFLTASFAALIPLFLNHTGYLRLARLSLCWIPPIITIALYTKFAHSKGGVLLISEFDSIYLFLLSTAGAPYLLLGISNWKDLILGLSVPSLLTIFCDAILGFLGVTHVASQFPADGAEMYRMRAFVSYFLLNTCCITIKTIVERQDKINEELIEKLEEQNILIEKQADEKLVESNNKYRLLFEEAIDAILLIDKDGKFEQVNPSACKIFGYTAEEFKNLSLFDLAGDVSGKYYLTRKLLNNSEPMPVELILRSKDNSLLFTEANVIMRPDEGFQLFIRNITKRKKAEQEVRGAEEKFRALVEKSLVGVYIINEGKFTYTNPQFASIFGYQEDEMSQCRPEMLIHPDCIDYFTRNSEGKDKTVTESTLYEIKGIHKNGRRINLQIFGNKTIINGKQSVIGTLMDITQNKLLQKTVLEHRVQEQKKIVRAVIRAEEKERNRIGRELHDNINQILASINLYLSIAEDDTVNYVQHIRNSKELTMNAINEIRDLSHGMVMPLKHIILGDLIGSLIERLATVPALTPVVTYKIRESALSDEAKLNVYRIIQEQIQNIIKHADAKNVTISLTEQGDFLTVLIKDDGKGFDMQKKGAGIGLSNIANRVASFNGHMEIKTSPGNGYTLKIKIPLSTEKNMESVDALHAERGDITSLAV